MGYELALSKAWQEVKSICRDEVFLLKFMADKYEINLKKQIITSASNKLPVKIYISILLLHYLKQRIKQIPKTKEEWISFSR